MQNFWVWRLGGYVAERTAGLQDRSATLSAPTITTRRKLPAAVYLWSDGAYHTRNIVEPVHPNRFDTHAFEDLAVICVCLSECCMNRFF